MNTLQQSDPDRAFHAILSKDGETLWAPIARLLPSGDFVNVCKHSDKGEQPFALYSFEDEFLGYGIVKAGPSNIRKFVKVPEGYRPKSRWFVSGDDYGDTYDLEMDYTFEGRPVFINPETQITWREGEMTHEQELAACHEVGRRYTETGDASVFGLEGRL